MTPEPYEITAAELEWRGLDHSEQKPGFMWRRAYKPDALYRRAVLLSPPPDRQIIERYRQPELIVGQVCSHPFFKRGDPLPYYHVAEPPRNTGCFWRVDELLVGDGISAGLAVAEVFSLPFFLGGK